MELVRTNKLGQRFAAFLLLLALFTLGVAVHAASPQAMKAFFAQSPLICPLRIFTGLKCTFCGMTHAWIAIFRGNFIEATRENFLSLPLFAFSISSLGIYAGGFEYSMKEARRKLLIGCLLALFLLYALARNLKGWP